MKKWGFFVMLSSVCLTMEGRANRDLEIYDEQGALNLCVRDHQAKEENLRKALIFGLYKQGMERRGIETVSWEKIADRWKLDSAQLKEAFSSLQENQELLLKVTTLLSNDILSNPNKYESIHSFLTQKTQLPVPAPIPVVDLIGSNEEEQLPSNTDLPQPSTPEPVLSHTHEEEPGKGRTSCRCYDEETRRNAVVYWGITCGQKLGFKQHHVARLFGIERAATLSSWYHSNQKKYKADIDAILSTLPQHGYGGKDLKETVEKYFNDHSSSATPTSSLKRTISENEAIPLAASHECQKKPKLN